MHAVRAVPPGPYRDRVTPALLPSLRRELDRLVEALSGVPSNTGPAQPDGSAHRRDGSRLVVVTAPAGGGLTTFLRALGDRCVDAQGHEPGRHLAGAELQHLVGLPWEGTEPGATLGALPRPPVVGPGASPLAAATSWLAGVEPTGARWDVVVLLEDGHHADPFSLRTLVSLSRRTGPARVLVVIGWRENGEHHADASLAEADGPQTRTGVDEDLHDTLVAAADHIVRLPLLEVADVAVLAEQRGLTLPPLQLERLLHHCGGRVRNVVELLGAVAPEDWQEPQLVLPAPPTAARATRAVLRSVAEDARRLVSAVAVLERGDPRAHGVPLGDAGRIVGVSATAPALEEALRAGLLRRVDELGRRVRTQDALVRQTVLDEIAYADRAQLHARAAGEVEDAASALRHQWFAAPEPDESLAAELEAEASRRAGTGAWAVAADLLLLGSRASTDPDAGARRLVGAVDALIGAGDVPQAMRFTPDVETLRETPLRNAVLGYLAVVRGRPAEAEHKLGRAWDLVNPRREPDTAALIAQRRVLHGLARCRPREVVEWADRAVELAPGTPAAVEAAAIRGLALAAEGGVAEALEDYRLMLDRLPHGPVTQRVVMASGWVHLAADDPDRAREELELASSTDQGGGSVRIALWARAWLARVQFLTGDWSDALGTAAAGLDLAHRSGITLLVPLMEWTRTQVHALRGDWDSAERCARAGDAGTRDYEIMRAPAALGRAALCEARADYSGVLRALGPLTQPWARGWVDAPGFWPWADVHANALVLAGRVDEADTFLVGHEQRAAASGHVSASARLSGARGRWHGARGDLDAARASFDRALELLEPLPLTYDRARVCFAYGQTLRRAGRRAQADAVISVARESYAALGALTYVERCDRELAAGGVNVVRVHREFDELTPQEEAVATLVARGRTNKEVAAELFLSVKTVQYHLTRTYAKLGVRSRSELAALRSGPTPG